MEKKCLIVNVGSTSKRYSSYLGDREVLRVKFEIGEKDFDKSVGVTKKKIETPNIIGVRVVSPGLYFQKDRVFDDFYLKKLKEAEKISPLHVSKVIKELINLKKEFPNSKIFCISDSSFHSDLNEMARVYGINRKDAVKFDIFRYGYHGISTSSVLKKIDRKNKKVIVCHLGGGASVNAVLNGKSFDASMGFTPLEGLFGGTRSGSIDFSAVKYLAERKKMNLSKVGSYLNFNSGFLGLTGEEDFRKVLKKFRNGDKSSKLAVEAFAYNVKKYIGSYIAAMNGVDMIIFTGAIGVGSSLVRRMILEDLDYLGIKLDEKRNLKFEDKEGSIESNESDVGIQVVESDESREMLKRCRMV